MGSEYGYSEMPEYQERKSRCVWPSLYGAANKRQYIVISDIKLIIMTKLIFAFTIAFKIWICQVFFNSGLIKNCGGVDSPDRQFPSLCIRLYLDIKYSVAYN